MSRRFPRCGPIVPQSLLLLILAWPGSPASAQTGADAPGSRGRLLYATHCIACHDTQVHWRDGRLATNWPSLKAQVRHWQARALLNWSEADIVEVTRHLNDTIYRFPQTSDQLGLLWPP